MRPVVPMTIGSTEVSTGVELVRLEGKPSQDNYRVSCYRNNALLNCRKLIGDKDNTKKVVCNKAN